MKRKKKWDSMISPTIMSNNNNNNKKRQNGMESNLNYISMTCNEVK